MKYTHIIFDVDGTLWNACPTTAKGINNALAHLGIEKKLTGKDIEQYSGEPCTEAAYMVFGPLADEHPTLLQDADNGEREAIMEDGGVLYSGVQEGLRQLSEMAKVSLVSNCQDWYMECFIDFADIRSLLTAYDSFGASHVPKDEMIKRILDGSQPEDAVYVGDTSRDFIAASKAGVDFIGAAYGFGDVSNVETSFQSFSEIVGYLS